MEIYFGPLQGLIIGLLLLFFKEKISFFAKNTLEKFPKYQDGIKLLNINLDVRPAHIMIIGLIFIFLAVAGFLKIIFR